MQTASFEILRADLFVCGNCQQPIDCLDAGHWPTMHLSRPLHNNMVSLNQEEATPAPSRQRALDSIDSAMMCQGQTQKDKAIGITRHHVEADSSAANVDRRLAEASRGHCPPNATADSHEWVSFSSRQTQPPVASLDTARSISGSPWNTWGAIPGSAKVLQTRLKAPPPPPTALLQS